MKVQLKQSAQLISVYLNTALISITVDYSNTILVFFYRQKYTENKTICTVTVFITNVVLIN